MHLLALSIVCSVIVSVLLKLARRHGVDVRQAIAVNYLVAAALAVLFLKPRPGELLAHPAELAQAWPVYLALALLLPSIFAVMAVSIRRVGVARTDAAQRLSLLLPLLAAFTLFGEAWSWHKGVGIAVGLAAIACLLVQRPHAAGSAAHADGDWRWLLAVFLGLGVIDILFKRLAQLGGLSQGTALLTIFALAFVVSLLGLCVLWWRGRLRPGWRHVGGGVLLGLFNFANILFYIRAHRALPDDPALVFSAMNIGVIALGALVGLWVFREPLGTLNKAGIALAAAAVLVIASA